MKRYFAWKDAGCNGIDPEWIEISGEEFALLKKENPQRRFIPSYNEDDPEDGDCFLYEATKKAFRDWNREHMRYVRHNALLYKKYKVVNLDDLVDENDEEGLTWADIIPDTSEEDVMAHEAWEDLHEKRLNALRECVENLKSKEIETLQICIYDNPEGKSINELSKEKGIPQTTLNYRWKKLKEKLTAQLNEKLAKN